MFKQAPFTSEFIPEYLYIGILVDSHLYTSLDLPYNHYDGVLNAIRYYLEK